MPRDPAKSPLDDRIRAEHMLSAARDVLAFAKGRRREDLETDTLLRRAMVNAIQEIGEAASQISPVGRARLPGVVWPQIVGMRHRLGHGYNEINLDMVWVVATQEAALLVAALEEGFVGWPLPEPPPAENMAALSDGHANRPNAPGPANDDGRFPNAGGGLGRDSA